MLNRREFLGAMVAGAATALSTPLRAEETNTFDANAFVEQFPQEHELPGVAYIRRETVKDATKAFVNIRQAQWVLGFHTEEQRELLETCQKEHLALLRHFRSEKRYQLATLLEENFSRDYNVKQRDADDLERYVSASVAVPFGNIYIATPEEVNVLMKRDSTFTSTRHDGFTLAGGFGAGRLVALTDDVAFVGAEDPFVHAQMDAAEKTRNQEMFNVLLTEGRENATLAYAKSMKDNVIYTRWGFRHDFRNNLDSHNNDKTEPVKFASLEIYTKSIAKFLNIEDRSTTSKQQPAVAQKSDQPLK